MQVHKRVIPIKDTQTMKLKGFCSILSVAVQNNELVLYYLSEVKNSHMQTIAMVIRGTGHCIEQAEISGFDFMGTHLMYRDSLVYHVWIAVV